MKKLIITLLTTLLLFGQQANAANIEVLPTMQSKTNVQDRVWVGTFQIVWNDFMEKIAHSIVKFPEGTPEIVNELNKQDFTVNELSENCYYRYVGKIQKNTKKTIVKAIKKRFQESSDLLDKLDLRGERVEEALDNLEVYLDKASLANLSPVYIIHGHGTGALKSAVRDFLSTSPYVAKFRVGEDTEGGDGVSVVDIK